MKGIIIYEDYRGKKVVEAIKLGEVVYNCKIGSSDDVWTNELSGIRKESTQAYCNESDTYDFETGALIALMKMCGLEKSAKAYAEIFDDTAYGDALIERDKLKEENKRLNASICAKSILNDQLSKDYNTAQNAYEVMVEKSADLMDKVKKLEEENEKLQHDYNLCLNSENALKYTVDSLNKSVDKLNKAIEGYKNDLYNTAKRCKELERAYKASNDDEAKLVEYYQREIKKLEAENEKLKLDCEKLQHGYVDIDNVPSGHWDGDILDIVFLPGRAYGKQYKTLVEMFKKIDQKKVDAAYKEAYNTELPIWQKEFLNQMYGIYKGSKEKSELPRTLDINGTTYRKTIQIKDFGEQINKLTVDSLIEESRAFTRKCVDEWLYKPPTKREEMWEEIFALHKEKHPIIVVKKEDVNTFLHEIENKNPEITWASGVKIFEAKGTIKDIYIELKRCDTIYFRLSKETKLSYSSDPYIYPYYEFEHISYLPPMRWDLFKKSRLAVKVTYRNYKEFYESCEKELGKKPSTYFSSDYTVSICKKDGCFEVFTVEHQKKTGRKIVDWEDVR